LHVNLRYGDVRVTDVNPTSNPRTDRVSTEPQWVGIAPARTGPSFADWYRHEFHQVVGLVYVLSGSRTAAEELAQDAFTEAHRRWATVGAYDDPGAWVRRVAVNRARSWGRRRSAEARAYAKHIGRERELPVEMPESADAFWAAVRALPDRQAQIIALHYVDDRPVDDIAEILHIDPSTVKTHLHRARASLAITFALDTEDAS
jgi:RNA polymerase sigma-70 factor (ECF subfamily)